MFLTRSFSMDSIDRFESLSSLMVKRRDVFISFSLEKFLSHEATETQMVRNKRNITVRFGRVSKKLHLAINSRNCFAFQVFVSLG
ncbi:unnamed protein product, partial [Ixodes pacificus]